MSATELTISTAEALVAASSDRTVRTLHVSGKLTGVPGFRLSPGQSLRGADKRASVTFADGVDGLQLSTDNEVRRLRLVASVDQRAIYNDTGVATLGQLTLRDLTVHGRVQILAREAVRAGHVEVDGLDIIAADARAASDRPQGYGVHVLQGAFTLWNMQTDAAVDITADLTGLSAGRPAAPVRGGGVFVSGAGDTGGRLLVTRLETGAVYSDGGIAPGTADEITGGVFTVHGAHVDLVRNRGPVVTYGQNDMVLDNWGVVDRWLAEAKITSHGPSGIGFVNFGIVRELMVEAPIETFGQGSRGFNVYAGTVERAEFDRVVTHADGAVGIQISQPIGRLTVKRGIETFGGVGDSLVKGVVVKLAAIALSLKPGGSAREIAIAGGVRTHGAGVAPIEQHGSIGSLRVGGGFVAAGGGFETI